MPIVPLHKRVLSEEEFGCLFAGCRMPFVRIANSYVRDIAVAEDLVDDSFVQLWEKRGYLQTDYFEAYLFRIVVHKCLNYLKSYKVQSFIRQKIHSADYTMLIYKVNSRENSDLERLYWTEVIRLAYDTMDRLPELTGKIFIDSRVYQKTYLEIAADYNVSVRRVTSEIQKVLYTLRIVLKDYLPIIVLIFTLIAPR